MLEKWNISLEIAPEIGCVSKMKIPPLLLCQMQSCQKERSKSGNHDSEFAFQWILRLDNLSGKSVVCFWVDMRSSNSATHLVDIGNWPSQQSPKWSYRIGNASFEFRSPFILIVIVCAFCILMYFKYSKGLKSHDHVFERDFVHVHNTNPYNTTYPLTRPVITPEGLRYRIGAIADPDQDSKVNSLTWIMNVHIFSILWLFILRIHGFDFLKRISKIFLRYFENS